MIHDLRYAARTLAQRPGFTLVVVVTLACGIGAVTSVIDLVNLLAWQKPPIERPEEVVEIYTASSQPFIGAYGATSFPDYEVLSDTLTSLAGVAAFMRPDVAIDSGEMTQSVAAWVATGNIFEVLGVKAAAGRLIESADDEPGRPPVVAVSYDLWRRLGADPALLGETVRLAGSEVTVVGIVEEGFSGTLAGDRVDLFLPRRLAPRILDPEAPWFDDRDRPSWNVVGRLKPGVELAQVTAELAVVAERLDREHPVDGLERRLSAVPAAFSHPVDRVGFGPTLRLFGAAVALLLVIVCANVGNLLLARAASRRREMGVRQSLGASRRRLVRQLLTESLLLALLGGLGGLSLAFWGRSMIEMMVGAEFAAAMRFDHRVLGLTSLTVLATTVLFGLGPALMTSRVDLVSALKDGGGSARGRRRVAVGPLLATAQVALSLVLLISTGALVKSLWEYRQADIGVDSENLLLAWVDTSSSRYSRAATRTFFRQLEERAAAVPGVSSAGLGLLPPPIFLDVKARFRLPEDPETVHSSRLDFADAGYLETLGLPLLTGRLFDQRDRAADPETGGDHGVVVISSVLAEQLWPGENAVGRTIRLERQRKGDPGRDYEVIGVVGSTVQFRLSRQKEPAIYFSWAQRHRPSLSLVVRAEGEPAAVFAALREELRALDPGLVLENTRTHADRRWETLVEQRLHVQTLGLFGLAGFVLALLGIFGVMSYAVNRQVREIGLRMALGARQADIRDWILRRGLAMTLAGSALGLVGAYWAMELLRAWVEGWVAGAGVVDPLIFGVATLVLLVASLAAVYLPARRAAGIEPLRALHYE